MNPKHLPLFAALLCLAACTASNHGGKGKPAVQARTQGGKRPAAKNTATAAQQPIRIKHVSRLHGSQELMLRGMDLIGTPYRWGGSNDSGFDCSGMVQYIYKNAVNVNLPRSSRDMAAASRTIRRQDLQTGDLVFFDTAGNGTVSHVGLYLGGGKFLHSPRSGSTVQTETLDKPYYAKRFIKAGTFF
ncbi:MAG: C40 family peptidase [Neisseria sp.]|nr:C40 family peptidase [Neisseria sp.]